MNLRSLIVLTLCVLCAAPAFAREEPTFTPVKHASFVIQDEGVTLFVDPVDADAFGKFPPPDVILITDIHGDHLNPDVIAKLRGKKTIVVGPKAVTDEIEGGTTLANGESTTLGKVTLEAIPMYNLTEKRLKYHWKGRGNGYIVTLSDKRIYISGDTEDIPEMRALKDIDYAFVCMNLPYTMTVEQAASAVLEMKPAVVIPYHYGSSDVEKFAALVGKNKDIEVRHMEWYP